MKLAEINWQPSDRQLRQFGFVSLFALPGFGWLWGAGNTTLAVFAALGILMTITGFARPSLLKPVFLSLSIVTMPLGIVIGEFTMLTIYYGLFLPLGLIFRMIGRDALERQLDRNCDSYWVPKMRPSKVGSYYRQS